VRRRDFIRLLGGAAAAWPLVARAQQVGRIYRIGGLHQAPHDAPHHVAFFAELQRVGIIEGQNLIIDRRGYGQRPERFAELVQEQINAQLDVILCGGEAAGRAAQQATTTIPIIVVADDMIRSGLVRSLAQPGGNTTGVSILASELDGKRQEILMEAVPGLRNMAILADPNTTAIQQLHALRDMTQVRGVEVSIHQFTRSE
jgi:putative ABC transport system substrate-binding protein